MRQKSPTRTLAADASYSRLLKKGKKERAAREQARASRIEEVELDRAMDKYVNNFVEEQGRRLEWNPLEGQKRFMSVREYERHLPKAPLQPGLAYA